MGQQIQVRGVRRSCISASGSRLWCLALRLTDQLENQARTIKGMEERSKHEMLEIMASMQQLTKQLEMLKSIQPPLRVKFTTLNGLFNTGPTIVDYVSPFQARVTLSGGIQQWVVPVTGNYKLTAIGASGGGPNGGLGAIVVTTLNLQRGQTINILVGQTGDGSWVGGGGGGTFVWENGATVQGSAAPTTNGKILVCAGGGGGAAGIRRGDPAYCKDYWSVGGKGGKGGGGCGAGWLSDGGPSEKGAGPGLTPMRGGTGGAPHPSYSGRGSGGFGGGGGCGCWDKRSGEESSTVDFGGGGGGFSGGNSNLEGGGDGGTSFIFNKNTRVGSYSRLAPAPCEGSVVFQLLPPKTLEPLFG
ncbi:hypothetical protein Pelo_12598 [Pelomyxa schiedti]|nr:hypothetical protein Pelo_12598 [Pelomyxa schiedti]